MQVFAQDRSVSGRIVDAKGQPIPGATVFPKADPSRGTVTDNNGNFTISVPDGATLVASFIGMQTIEFTANQNSFNLTMEEDSKMLKEVSINALGFQVDRDRIGTATSTVKGSEAQQSGETSILNGLAGKAPGLNITRNGGDPGAGVYIQLRGQTTITGDLQPLFIIDGMPLFNSFVDNGNQVDGVQQQSRLNDLNPDDIESIEVLPGAAAAALWGSRAANGVIVITTKKGKNTNGKINISYRGSVSIDRVNRLPELQQVFGQGRNGVFLQGNPRSWGDKIADRDGGDDVFILEGQPGYQGFAILPDGRRVGRIANGDPTNRAGGKRSTDVFDHAGEVFQTGSFFDNALSLSGGTDRTSFYVSYSNLNQQGIIRQNSDYKRNTIRANASTVLSNNLKAGINVNYTNVRSNRIQQGSNLGGIFLGGLRTPADFDNSVISATFVDPDGVAFPNRPISYRNPFGRLTNPGFDNPLWTIANNKNFSQVNRFLGNVDLSYDPLSWLNLSAVVGVDTYTDRQTQFINARSAISPGGAYTEQSVSETQYNANLFAKASKTFNESLSGYALLGFNYNARFFNSVGATARNFIIPDAPGNLGNSSPNNREPFNTVSEIVTAASFFELGASYLDQLYLTATGRWEAASTFGPQANNLFFYPSISASWIFSKLTGDSDIFSYGKLRASYGEVGRQPNPYLNLTQYIPGTFTESWGGTLAGAQYGVGGYQISTIAGNPGIRPERKSEVEAGFDLAFFKNRITTSFTAFYNKSTDLILAVDIPGSSGFGGQVSNAATIENRGLEFTLQPIWAKTDKFTWSTNFIWSLYRNKVLDLRGAESVILSGGGFSDGSSRAVEGFPLGVLWGTLYAKDENGAFITDGNGFPTLAANEGVIGDPNPNYRASIGNLFSFTGAKSRTFNIYALFDFSVGGQMWNGTRGALVNYGVAKETAVETTVSAAEAAQIRTFDGFTVGTSPRSIQNPDGSFTFRGILKDFGSGVVALDEAWYTGPGGGFGINQPFVEDATWSRLRELTLSYGFKTSLWRKDGMQSNVSFGVTGRNLVLWTPYKGIDPETNLTGANNGRGLDYFQNPNTRSYLFNVQINF
jgi:TonB-linked SusC/RagA family outer membrane protein